MSIFIGVERNLKISLQGLLKSSIVCYFLETQSFHD